MQLFTCHPDVITALNHQLDAQWLEFGTFLWVDYATMKIIEENEKKVESRMLTLVQKWLDHENGTGKLPRTWTTVVHAVQQMGKGQLAEQLAEKYGGHLQAAK